MQFPIEISSTKFAIIFHSKYAEAANASVEFMKSQHVTVLKIEIDEMKDKFRESIKINGTAFFGKYIFPALKKVGRYNRSDEAMPNLLCGNTMNECDACFDRYFDSIVAKDNNDPIIQSKKRIGLLGFQSLFRFYL